MKLNEIEMRIFRLIWPDAMALQIGLIECKAASGRNLLSIGIAREGEEGGGT